jgi:hypothetical protein
MLSSAVGRDDRPLFTCHCLDHRRRQLSLVARASRKPEAKPKFNRGHYPKLKTEILVASSFEVKRTGMLKDFVTALESGDWEAVRCAQKADLHIHGFGGGDRAFLREKSGVDVAPVDGVLGSMAEMHAFVDERLSALFAGRAGRALAIEATFVQALKDGVTRLEVGEDVWSITLHRGSAEAVRTTLQEAHQARRAGRGVGPTARYLATLRHCIHRTMGCSPSRTRRVQNAGPLRR